MRWCCEQQTKRWTEREGTGYEEHHKQAVAQTEAQSNTEHYREGQGEKVDAGSVNQVESFMR